MDRTTSRPTTPHRELMVAVLEVALEDASDMADRTGAAAWVTSTDRGWPFSFENICEALDVDPCRVRQELQRGVGSPQKPATDR